MIVADGMVGGWSSGRQIVGNSVPVDRVSVHRQEWIKNGYANGHGNGTGDRDIDFILSLFGFKSVFMVLFSRFEP